MDDANCELEKNFICRYENPDIHINDDGYNPDPIVSCTKTAQHRCTCPGGQEYEILIDGNSVIVGAKPFTPEEILLLQSINQS